MQIPINLFKRSLNKKTRQIGLFLGLADAYSAEIVATAGFDWLLIDGEHGPNDLRSIRDQLQVLAAYPTQQAVVRTPDHNPALIKQLLDIGAQTLMVPMVSTKAQAQAIVSAMCYPPRGIRGVGTAMARAARWNAVEDYFQQVDSQLCLIIQIETVSGLENLEEIVQVDGVDAIFIGPSDLAASMGYLGQPGHPAVKKIVAQALAKIVEYDKAAGVFSAEPTVALEYEQLGASFMLVGVDTLLLGKASKALASDFGLADNKNIAAY